jgi:hypothetical protein
MFASDMVASRNDRDVSATELAAALGIEETRAERLLAQLSADNLVAAHVTQEGEVVFGASAPGRVRVEPAESPPTGEDDGESSGAQKATARAAEGPRE